jgi:transposase
MNSAAAEPTAATSASTVQSPHAPTPFDQEWVTLSKRESIELRQRASSYQTLHARAVQRQARQEQHCAQRERWAEREAELLGELQAALAQIRDLRQRVFGAKTEQSRSVGGAQPSLVGPRRPRGQQRGHRGHGRRREAALPTRVEEQTLQASCPRCGLELAAFAGTQDAEVLEIEVKAYRRVIRRHRYRPVCRCGCLPGIVVAPRPPQLIARGKLCVSIWV